MMNHHDSLSSLERMSPLTLIDDDYFGKSIKLYIKRDELLHPWVNGNKWRKLKPQVGRLSDDATIITFGGAFSNHLVAVAYYAYRKGIRSVGVIRSYKSDVSNPILDLLREWLMELHFVHPEEYLLKENGSTVTEISQGLSDYLIIPEGGTNELAASGTRGIMEEVYAQSDIEFDVVATCIGTGGTIAGIASSLMRAERVIGLSPFKGEVNGLANSSLLKDHEIEFHSYPNHKRFAQYDEVISDYTKSFYDRYEVLLDPIYTSRGMITIDALVDRGDIREGSNVLFIHTGGLPGIIGYNYLHKHKKTISIPYAYRYLQIPSTT